MSAAAHFFRLRGPAWDVPTPAQLLTAQAKANTAAIAALPQGSDDWKRARYGYMSGSIAAHAAGFMGPAAQRSWLVDAVWPEYAGLYGSAARYAAIGTRGEPVAKSVYEAHRAAESVACELTGFCVHPTETWLGSSPDLVIREPKGLTHATQTPCSNPHWQHEPYVIAHADGPDAFVARAAPKPPVTAAIEYVTGTGEIKCIASAAQEFYSANPRYKKYGIPLQYYIQIQIECEVLNANWNDFIVHLPAQTQVIRFYRNRAYFNDELLPALRSAYFDLFLPQLEARATGKLTEPQTLHEAILPPPRLKTRRRRASSDEAKEVAPPAAKLEATAMAALHAFLK